MTLLTRTPYDEEFYQKELKDFLPDTFIDCHTHCYRKDHLYHPRTKITWTSLVAEDNPIEDLVQTNEELFPGKKVISVLYPEPMLIVNVPKNNEYVREEGLKRGFPALYLSRPEQSPEELEKDLVEGGYAGLKVYLCYAPSYIPADEVRIYDFLPKEHLKVVDKLGLPVVVHIPRSGRLKDPVNYVQLAEIDADYPNLTLVVAHLGRAYADSDVGNALDYLKDMKKAMWDFTANTNQHVMEQVLELFGPKRFMYGSDFPIFRMHARRVVENGIYINEIPKGSLGNFPPLVNMREIPNPEAERITCFIYEEIASCKRAAANLGLTKEDINDIFYANAAKLFGVGGKQ